MLDKSRSGEPVLTKTPLDDFGALQRLGFWWRLRTAFKLAARMFALLRDRDTQTSLIKLSLLRGESPARSLLHAFHTGMQLIPRNLDALDGPVTGDVVRSVERTTSDVFRITTSDAMSFYDWAGSKKHAQLYWLMRDKARRFYTQETYFAGAAVYRSYVNGIGRFPGDAYIPRAGGTVVEAGSYVGYKAIRFAQQVGPTGRVGIIEASPENYDLLVKNIDANGLSEVARTINCAVWNGNGEVVLTSKGRMRHTVTVNDEPGSGDTRSIPAHTLDYIIKEFGFEQVDFLNLQLNGVEIEAIDGLKDCFDRVRYINVITRNRRETVDICKDVLIKRGCKVLVDSRMSNLFNLTVQVP